MLDLPASCFQPEHEPYISAILRHILEDPATLQSAMEAEIRNTLTKGRPGKNNPFSRGMILSQNCKRHKSICIMIKKTLDSEMTSARALKVVPYACLNTVSWVHVFVAGNEAMLLLCRCWAANRGQHASTAVPTDLRSRHQQGSRGVL